MSDEKPIKLVPAVVKVRDGEISTVIDTLAEMHEKDEIESIVVYAVLRNGENYANRSSSGDTMRLAGGIAWCLHRFLADYEKQ